MHWLFAFVRRVWAFLTQWKSEPDDTDAKVREAIRASLTIRPKPPVGPRGPKPASTAPRTADPPIRSRRDDVWEQWNEDHQRARDSRPLTQEEYEEARKDMLRETD